jgi:hypothetical protein
MNIPSVSLPCVKCQRKKHMTIRLAVILGLLAGLVIAGWSQASDATIETPHLIASDASGTLSKDRLQELVNHAQSSLERILEFWSADSGVSQYGKIRVIFNEPRRRIHYVSVFGWDREHGRRIRVVRVFGAEKQPQEMVHKLTSAIFPHTDKLIRNMMGVPTEERLGNPLTFPGCGFSSDDWVRAFLKSKSLIPLNELGPDHESWGMKIAGDGLPSVFDRARESKTYAQAGSFGNYLIRTYGIDKMREFYVLSNRKKRPWQDVFGMTLEALQADWIKALQTHERTIDENVSALAQLFEADPNTACLRAQAFVAEAQ